MANSLKQPASPLEPTAERAALAELVACIDWVETGVGMSREEYRRREPLAWQAARAALARRTDRNNGKVSPV